MTHIELITLIRISQANSSSSLCKDLNKEFVGENKYELKYLAEMFYGPPKPEDNIIQIYIGETSISIYKKDRLLIGIDRIHNTICFYDPLCAFTIEEYRQTHDIINDCISYIKIIKETTY